MTKETLLKTILEIEDLKKEYWPDVDVNTINMNTLSRHNNKYLKYLHYLLSSDSKAVKINSILNTFQLG